MVESLGDNCGCAASEKWVEDNSAFGTSGSEASFDELLGKDSKVGLAEL